MLNTLLSHDDECSFIREAFSKGVTFFDTSDVYRFMHDNEFMIGKMRELKKLVEERKIKCIGLPEASVNTVRRAHAIHPITAVQMEYSLWTHEIEDAIILICRIHSFLTTMEHTSNIQVQKVKLGNQGLEVSRLGFGCAGLSGMLNAPLSHEDGCSIIKEAFSKGITFFDTSDVYGYKHDNEIMIGKALKQLPRGQVQLATKFGVRFTPDMKVIVNGTPEYVRECCESSLKRLGVDYIDLYYQHRVDTSVPIENTIGELKKLVEEGKIKYIGLSEASVDTVRRAHAIHPITAVQMEYSVWTREIEDDIIPICRELGIGIVSYGPLGHGFFGGKAAVESLSKNSAMNRHPRFTGENLEKNKLLYNRFADLAAKHSCTPPQLALAWLLHQEDGVVPIPGTTKTKNLEANIGSLGVKLSHEDVKEISKAIPADEVNGEREISILSGYCYKLIKTPKCHL